MKIYFLNGNTSEMRLTAPYQTNKDNYSVIEVE